MLTQLLCELERALKPIEAILMLAAVSWTTEATASLSYATLGIASAKSLTVDC